MIVVIIEMTKETAIEMIATEMIVEEMIDIETTENVMIATEMTVIERIATEMTGNVKDTTLARAIAMKAVMSQDQLFQHFSNLLG
jgi:histidinol phosphatase-like enzyme